MPKFHFLNVREGDCSIIEHWSGRTTVIDVCNAKALTELNKRASDVLHAESIQAQSVRGNFNQKAYPVNPIKYMSDRGLSNIFRFVATHPDMDHLDGIEALFEAFAPQNFWDTDNNAEKDFAGSSKYRESDWLFYKNLRNSKPTDSPKRLALLSGATGEYFNKDDRGGGGDGLHVLAPTNILMAQANECGDYNDSSYMILYRTGRFKILLSGDSDDDSWEYVLSAHSASVKDVDLLIAPHHGRDSGRSYTFLDHVNPKMTFFGNARSEYLAYGAWNTRQLPFVTNNQANCMIVDPADDKLALYVTHEAFARSKNPYTFYSSQHRGYFYGYIA